MKKLVVYSLPFCSHCPGCEGTCDDDGDGEGEGPVNGNNDTELVSVMCAAASTITPAPAPAPVLAWTPGFYYFGIVKRSIVGRGPAAGCLNGAASRGQHQL